MRIDKESKAWASKKLARFTGWRGFPTNQEDVDARVRSFLRLVHGVTIREIIEAAARKNGVPISQIDWSQKNMDPDQIDADWILDFIAETMDYFPLPVNMREIYTTYLPPASVFGEIPGKSE